MSDIATGLLSLSRMAFGEDLHRRETAILRDAPAAGRAEGAASAQAGRPLRLSDGTTLYDRLHDQAAEEAHVARVRQRLDTEAQAIARDVLSDPAAVDAAADFDTRFGELVDAALDDLPEAARDRVAPAYAAIAKRHGDGVAATVHRRGQARDLETLTTEYRDLARRMGAAARNGSGEALAALGAESDRVLGALDVLSPGAGEKLGRALERDVRVEGAYGVFDAARRAGQGPAHAAHFARSVDPELGPADHDALVGRMNAALATDRAGVARARAGLAQRVAPALAAFRAGHRPPAEDMVGLRAEARRLGDTQVLAALDQAEALAGLRETVLAAPIDTALALRDQARAALAEGGATSGEMANFEVIEGSLLDRQAKALTAAEPVVDEAVAELYAGRRLTPDLAGRLEALVAATGDEKLAAAVAEAKAFQADFEAFGQRPAGDQAAAARAAAAELFATGADRLRSRWVEATARAAEQAVRAQAEDPLGWAAGRGLVELPDIDLADPASLAARAALGRALVAEGRAGEVRLFQAGEAKALGQRFDRADAGGKAGLLEWLARGVPAPLLPGAVAELADGSPDLAVYAELAGRDILAARAALEGRALREADGAVVMPGPAALTEALVAHVGDAFRDPSARGMQGSLFQLAADAWAVSRVGVTDADDLDGLTDHFDQVVGRVARDPSGHDYILPPGRDEAWFDRAISGLDALPDEARPHAANGGGAPVAAHLLLSRGRFTLVAPGRYLVGLGRQPGFLRDGDGVPFVFAPEDVPAVPVVPSPASTRPFGRAVLP